METRRLNGLELRWGLAEHAALAGAESLWKDVAASGRLSGHPVFRSYVEGLSFEPPGTTPWARSLAVAVLATKPRVLRFELEDGVVTVPFPSCYGGSPVSREDVRRFLAETLGGSSRCEAAESVPLKLAAAWIGLARYGRNGLCHAPGLGSSIRLLAFWTDLPAEEPGVRPEGPAFLDRCASCSACVRACPTCAIPTDYGCVDATRCLSLYNEIEGDLPGWIPARAHNAAIGCLACQRCCPESGRVLADEAGTAAFSAAELGLLQEGRDEPSTNAAVARATGRPEIDQVDAFRPVLARNLRAFLAARRMA